ncbi:uncharacterized protein LOC126995454 isoform X2 [Eriocheir sinensis]|uniref:uncharacterized protein LOC126995454 isoform X2 n=1 Tax=Eriocheir sinensis TaxID=95602 RepID=UPI0021C8CADD|nr:uncharacterized protein LOC126995454 isoform X2 [Eriocheir sinensis]
MGGFAVLWLYFVAQVLAGHTEGHRIVFPVIEYLEEGDPCTTYSGVPGKCVDLRECDYTRLTFKHESHFRCGFKGIIPVICCPPSAPGPALFDSHVPAKQDDSHVPAIHGHSHVPAIHDNSHVPSIKDDSHFPAIHDNSHVPAIHGESRVPAIHEDRHVPAIQDAFQFDL